MSGTDSWVEGLVAGLLRRHDRVWWLDGAAGRAWSGRSSLVGWLTDDEPSLTYDAARREVVEHRGSTSTVVGDDLFGALRARLAAPGGSRRWFGWAGYAARPDLPARTSGTGDTDGPPDACWMPGVRWVLVDHATGVVRPRLFELDLDGVVAPQGPPPAPAPVRLDADWSAATYAVAFDRVQEALQAGHTYEVNLTYRHRLVGGAGVEAAWQAYRRLRRVSRAPYAGFVHHRGTSLLAASPERFAAVTDGRLETRPVKGTVARLADPVADAEQARRLASDPRTRAENLIVCDLLRNDVATVSRPGSVQVPRLMEIETHPGLHQLVSTVRGRLADGVAGAAGVDAVEVLRALLPGGSMTGAPKLRTMQVIEAVEDSPRGVYSGAFGWLEVAAADLGMVIRSWVHRGDSWTAGTGGGVTVLSDAASEYAETRLKLAGLRAALGADG